MCRLGCFIYSGIHVLKQIKPAVLDKEGDRLMLAFSTLFTANIVVGNWSMQVG
jgi:hypothetical protein